MKIIPQCGNLLSEMFNSFSRKVLCPLNCIGRKELSHVHIKPHAMTRAMTFDKGLSERGVVY